MQPLLLPVCSLAAGMFLAGYADIPATQAAGGATAAALLAICARKLGPRGAAFAAMLVAVLLGGAWRYGSARDGAAARPIRALVDTGRIAAGDAMLVVGEAEDLPDVLPTGLRVRLGVKRLRLADGSDLAISGRASVSIRCSDQDRTATGALLRIERGTPLRIDAEAVDDLAYRNPGLETQRGRLRRRGLDLSLRAAGPDRIEVTGPPAGCPVLRWLSGVRSWGIAEIDRAFSVRSAGVMRALLLGDESHLDEATVEDYRNSGSYHVLVISGAHIALVAGLCLWISGFVTRSPLVRLVAGALPAWLYVLILGGPAPVVRAAIGVTVALLAPLAGRRAPPPNTLAVAAGVVLLADPAAIRDPSFQLTFAAVAAIVCIAAPIAARLADIGRWRPHRATPLPPVCGTATRALAEILFWDEPGFQAGRLARAVRFGVPKTRVARWLSRFRLQGTVRRTVLGLAMAAIVQVSLAPFSVAYFGRVTLAGIPWALAVEGLLAVALVSGVGFLAVRAVAPAAATPFAWIVERLVDLSGAAAAAAPAGWPVAAPAGWRAWLPMLAPFGAALVAAAVARWRPVPRALLDLAAPGTPPVVWKIGGALGLAMLVSLGAPSGRRPADGRLYVQFLDVGQGDAAFVRFPDGTTMLVDAGGRPRIGAPLGFVDGSAIFAEQFDVGDRVVTASLLAQGISEVDWLIATHGDVDHVGGFDAVMRRMSADRVIVGAGADGNERAFIRSSEARGSRILTLAAGDAIEVGGTRLEVLWPLPDAPQGNDGSLVFRLVYGRRAMLFTGDIETPGEAALLALAARNGWDVRADVLKVAHHGSRGSSSPQFLTAAGARWAVVSAPRVSPYGHPHAESLERLRNTGSVVLQTGIEGAVTFVTDGDRIEFLRISDFGTQLCPPDFDHGARQDRTNIPGGQP